MANVKDIHPGDKVQIKLGAVDITNNIKATHRALYLEGSSLWATVELVDPNWYGHTKVRCYAIDRGKKVIVWQVEPNDIANNIIHPEIPPQSKPNPSPPVVQPPVHSEPESVTKSSPMEKDFFVTTEKALSWKPPAGSNQITLTKSNQTGELTTVSGVGTVVTVSSIDDITPVKFNRVTDVYNRSSLMSSNISNNIGTNGISVDSNILQQAVTTAASNRNKLSEMLNDNKSIIQNDQSFPAKMYNSPASYDKYVPAGYDYSIETGLTSLGSNRNTKSLDESMTELRAVLGLPVHGDNTMARYMRYFLYNRFKTPDTNLAHNKSFTHVFFTRPDLNILQKSGSNISASKQCLNHTESTMLWMRNPTLFKLLVDKNHCGDNNNFNMLLSSAATSFQIEDETISVNEAGKSWNDYIMQYGNAYTGRSAGEFSVNFTDDKYYSIINLLKLWIIYIDNVARGAWSPSYDLAGSGRSNPLITDSHVYTKTLDYASSVYVIKTGEDGSDILYWTKYYGVFPVNTGASALSWDILTNPGDAPKLNIRFKYSYKRDLSPISLLEFNNCAGLPGSWDNLSRNAGKTVYESPFNTKYGHGTRPYVGLPFIEMKMPSSDPKLVPNAIDKSDRNLATLRLQFMGMPSLTGFTDTDIFGAKLK
jgi:hypothetical protein